MKKNKKISFKLIITIDRKSLETDSDSHRYPLIKNLLNGTEEAAEIPL